MKTNQSLVVFLGPSYETVRAKTIVEASYWPPARRGDVERAARSGAKTIVLIDGCMVHSLPPSPMEIYEVIRGGTTVVGAASLGALRGVELRYHGMTGSGWIYDRYLDGSIDSDDELVTLFDPRTGNPLTVPLVRIRYALSKLSEAGSVLEGQKVTLLRSLRSTYFEERTISLIRSLAHKCDLRPNVIDELFSPLFDIKALDTIECLRTL